MVLGTGTYTKQLRKQYFHSTPARKRSLTANAKAYLYESVKNLLLDGRQYYTRFYSTTVQDDKSQAIRAYHLDLFLLDPTECLIGDYWFCNHPDAYRMYKNRRQFYVKAYADDVQDKDKTISVYMFFEMRRKIDYEGYFVAQRINEDEGTTWENQDSV